MIDADCSAVYRMLWSEHMVSCTCESKVTYQMTGFLYMNLTYV